MLVLWPGIEAVQLVLRRTRLDDVLMHAGESTHPRAGACAERHGARLHVGSVVYLGKLGLWLSTFVASSGDPAACRLEVGTAAAAVQRDRNRVLHAYDCRVF